MIFDKTLNGWSYKDEKLYNELTVEERHLLNKALLAEIKLNVPFNRKSFKMVYFLTLKRRPEELFTDRKICMMQIELLQKEIDVLKKAFRIK